MVSKKAKGCFLVEGKIDNLLDRINSDKEIDEVVLVFLELESDQREVVAKIGKLLDRITPDKEIDKAVQAILKLDPDKRQIVAEYASWAVERQKEIAKKIINEKVGQIRRKLELETRILR